VVGAASKLQLLCGAQQQFAPEMLTALGARLAQVLEFWKL
jgi:hypothetical protein